MDLGPKSTKQWICELMLISCGWEVSLPDVGLSKSVRVASASLAYSQNGQYLLRERFVPPQNIFMVFRITFVLTLFHDKKYCNCTNLFFCILWDFIVLGLVLSWWRLLKKLILRLGSWVMQPAKVTWESHVGSWRVKCQAVFRESLCDSGEVVSDPRNSLPRWF